MTVRIAHLYPREMSLYGDTGNIIAVRKRLQWRGHDSAVAAVEAGEDFDFSTVDMIIGGGGPDSGQAHIAADLVERGDDVKAALAAGVPALVVCGLFQLFGRSFTTNDGAVIPGIGVFDAVTVATRRRIVGNVELATRFGRLVGFENHSGMTRLGPDQEPFGRVVSGRGPGRRRREDGAVSGAAIGTYLHGPVLPRNPLLADFLIDKALAHRASRDGRAPVGDPTGSSRVPHGPASRT